MWYIFGFCFPIGTQCAQGQINKKCWIAPIGTECSRSKGCQPLYAHNTNINNRHQTGTNLSKYVWKLKDNQPHSIPYEIEWGILGTDKPFNSVTGVCRLCLLEAYFFMFDEASSTLCFKYQGWILVHLCSQKVLSFGQSVKSTALTFPF